MPAADDERLRARSCAAVTTVVALVAVPVVAALWCLLHAL
jgi:hypothetical protein